MLKYSSNILLLDSETIFALCMSIKQKLVKPLIKKSSQIPSPTWKNIFLVWRVHKIKGPVHAQMHVTPQQRDTLDISLYLVLCLSFKGAVYHWPLFPHCA